MEEMEEIVMTNLTKQILETDGRMNNSLTSLIGTGVGASVFLMVVMLGVVFWVTREKDVGKPVKIETKPSNNLRNTILSERLEGKIEDGLLDS